MDSKDVEMYREIWPVVGDHGMFLADGRTNRPHFHSVHV